MEEVWRKIPGYEPYEASNLSRLRNAKTSRILVSYHNPLTGYVQIRLFINGTGVTRLVHRLLALAFLDLEEKSELQVNHIDFDRSNNALSNLELVTRSENALHSRRAVRWPFSKAQELRVKRSERDHARIQRLNRKPNMPIGTPRGRVSPRDLERGTAW